MDVCVITFHNGAHRVSAGLRPHDHLWIRDNTRDNVGFARAANELAAKGADPLILFVNPDGDPQPGCFDRLEAAMNEPGVVAAAAVESSEPPPDRDWLTAACLVVRRSAFEQVGGFDESFFMYGEDVDLSWRLAKYGRLELCRNAVFLHDQGTRQWRASFRMARNNFRLKRKWGRPPLVLRGVHHGLHDIRSGRWSLGTARITGAVAFAVLDLARPSNRPVIRNNAN